MLFCFAPWMVYWALVDNVPSAAAALIALAMAVAAFAIGGSAGKPWQLLQTGSVATFLVLTILTFLIVDTTRLPATTESVTVPIKVG
jgi:hypothetical protein